jgi:hypothetical protein
VSFDAQALFVNLAEKERVKGHHSPEGRAIRILSRALNGWAVRSLSGEDVLVLCEQALEDWLKNRLKLSAWSTRNIVELGAAAAAQGLITETDAARLKRIVSAHSRLHGQVDRKDVEGALEFCIYLVEKHW